MTTFTSEDRILAQQDIDIEEVILALKAAGYSTPQYEILPNGAVHYFYGTKKDNSLLHRDEPRGQDGRDNT